MTKTLIYNLRNWCVLVALLMASATLLGCASGASVNSTASIPKPLIAALPVDIGIHYTHGLKHYVYEEPIAEHGTFTIELGQSQEHLFDQVFGTLFTDLSEVESLEEIPSNVSGVLVPGIRDVQIAIPQQNRGNFYEVWIRYSILLLDQDGKEVHVWEMSAYGKANKRNYSNPIDRPSQALTDATNTALRDAAAQISFAFTREPPVQRWLAGVIKS